MNREEILKSEYSKLIANPDKVYAQNPSIIKAAHSAMSEYAKIQCIGFAEFTAIHGWVYDLDNNYWLIPDVFPYKTKTSEQLYELYLKSIEV
jgi:hypothetical protein